MFDNQNNGVDNDNVGIGCVTVLFWVFWGGGWRNICDNEWSEREYILINSVRKSSGNTMLVHIILLSSLELKV